MLRCYTPLLRCGPYNYTFTPQLRSATQLALLRRCLYARRYALALPSLVCSYCVRATRRTCVLRGCALRLVWRCYAHCNSKSKGKPAAPLKSKARGCAARMHPRAQNMFVQTCTLHAPTHALAYSRQHGARSLAPSARSSGALVVAALHFPARVPRSLSVMFGGSGPFLPPPVNTIYRTSKKFLKFRSACSRTATLRCSVRSGTLLHSPQCAPPQSTQRARPYNAKEDTSTRATARPTA